MSAGTGGYLSIGEVLELLQDEFPDVTISKIRFLESQGLVDPERTPSGYRKFYDADVERLRWILQQQKEHFLPLRVIKDRLDAEGTRTGAPAAEPAPAPPPAPGDGPAAGAEAGTGGARQAPPSSGAVGASPGALRAGVSSASFTAEELASAAGIEVEQVRELERYGLLAPRAVAGQEYFDEEAFVVARVAGRFMRFGVEARHLRMYRTAAEREAGFFEQVVMPLLKQRNPSARQRAVEALGELAELGQSLRAAMVRQALRAHTDGG